MFKKYEITNKGAVITVTNWANKGKGIKILVTSDVHFDSALCNRTQFFEDMEVALENEAMILIIGDFFDAMNGRFDPRRDMSKLRPEYRREDYYDYIVQDAANKLREISKNILFIAPGNHELSVLKNANTDLTSRLAKKLSTRNHSIFVGGYGGIIMIQNMSVTIPIKYFHGSGGEAPVTRGAIQTNRQAVFLPDFKLVLNGHSHHMYWIPIVRERVNPYNGHYFDIQHHVRTPGYLMDYGDGTSGWEVTRGGVPKPIGSCLIDIKGEEILVTPIIHAPLPIGSVEDLY